ncbi:hypothetical protein KM914_21365 [Virgibacillus pantothenticus]|uniref:hypothetical protein n=1 Tax=Virgibacillus pantothenticus TaxID=1473 RepID=UPI001C21D367|nr:hypothetical protein [Virgibacillus pantothenticus]MBU8568914.1 hypothetical protein [Virgibacillus pantothenticus]MBU8644806.1 hypothetical protein [Virgibacillus pantothenticus]MBU8648927.1 hypothetical protein [Virgibacillus pantothenticus]MBU8662698.1 hypothetical protein [Virgibacillus pantothenticus]MBU8670997.1 hypothetical protein [Virgibacillus pantothenticus]
MDQPIDDLKKIKGANDKNVTQIDVNQIEVEKNVNLDFSVFFSDSMYRMVAKIAFEWYCLQNDISGKVKAFERIIQFITNGIGDDIVTIVGNEELYSTLKMNTNFGSHTLLSYIAKDNSVNVLISLFGIAIYNIRISDFVIDECRNNVIFQELTLDSKRVQFKFDTFGNFKSDFQKKFTEVELENGMKAKIPKDMTDVLIRYEFFYGTSYPLFQGNLQCTNKSNEKIMNIIIKNIEDILQSSVVILRGLKRFVKEHFNNFDEEIKLNPKSNNKKAMFMFYLLFTVGQSNGNIKNLSDLNKVLEVKFSSKTIRINDKMIYKLNGKIYSTANYSDIILKGAKTVYSWKYE